MKTNKNANTKKTTPTPELQPITAANAKTSPLYKLAEKAAEQERKQREAEFANKNQTKPTAPSVYDSPLYKLGIKAAEERTKAINAVLEDMQAISKEEKFPALRDVKMRPITESYISALQDMVDKTLKKPYNHDIDELELNAGALYDLHDRTEYMKLKFNEQDLDKIIHGILKEILAIAVSCIESSEDYVNFANEITGISQRQYTDYLKEKSYQHFKEVQ